MRLLRSGGYATTLPRCSSRKWDVIVGADGGGGVGVAGAGQGRAGRPVDLASTEAKLPEDGLDL